MRKPELPVLAACCALVAAFASAAAQHDPPRAQPPQGTPGSPSPSDGASDRPRPSVCDTAGGRRVPSWCRKGPQPTPTRPTQTIPTDPCDPVRGHERPSWCRNPNPASTSTLNRPVQPNPNDPCDPIFGCRSGNSPSPNPRDRVPDECNPARGNDLPSWCVRSRTFSGNARTVDLYEACIPAGGRPRPPWCRRSNPAVPISLERRAQPLPECDPTLGRRLAPWCDVRRPPSPGIRDGPNAVLDDCHPSRGALQPAWCAGRRGLRALPVARSSPAPPADDDVYVPFSGKRLDVFDWRLVREMNTKTKSNAVMSTLGVKMVLGMLHEAAARASAEELRRALDLPEDRPTARHIFRRTLLTLQEKNPGYVMRVANRVYLDESYEPRTGITNIYKSHYNAEIERVAFKNPAVVKPKINTWVSNFTNGLIKNLITNDQQIQDLVTMILNVIYFKGQWRHQFPKNKTAQGDFYVTPQKTVKVDYMHLTTDLYFCSSKKLDAKILRLPYEGKKYSMFLILPNKKENFDDMVQRMTPEIMREQLHALSKVEVHVQLPKFKFEFTVHVKEVLQRLGLTRIFTHSDEINLTKNKTKLVISKVIQKVALDVNEDGTEAASVTEINLQNMFGGQSHFIANHPFSFFVEEEKTGTIVFIGKVLDPSALKSQDSLTHQVGNAVRIPAANILEKDFSPDISAQKSDSIVPPVAPSQQE